MSSTAATKITNSTMKKVRESTSIIVQVMQHFSTYIQDNSPSPKARAGGVDQRSRTKVQVSHHLAVSATFLLSFAATVEYKVHNDGVRRESEFEVKGDSCHRNALCRRIYPRRRSWSKSTVTVIASQVLLRWRLYFVRGQRSCSSSGAHPE